MSARRAHSMADGAGVSARQNRVDPGSSQSLSRSAPDTLALDPMFGRDMFDPLYSLLPSTSSVSEAPMAQTAPLISPLDGANSFEFPLDPALTLDNAALGYLDDILDVTEGLSEDVFHVEDWSRYMWSPETGFEHLDTVYPPVTVSQ